MVREKHSTLQTAPGVPKPSAIYSACPRVTAVAQTPLCTVHCGTKKPLYSNTLWCKICTKPRGRPQRRLQVCKAELAGREGIGLFRERSWSCKGPSSVSIPYGRPLLLILIVETGFGSYIYATLYARVEEAVKPHWLVGARAACTVLVLLSSPTRHSSSSDPGTLHAALQCLTGASRRWLTALQKYRQASFCATTQLLHQTRAF